MKPTLKTALLLLLIVNILILSSSLTMAASQSYWFLLDKICVFLDRTFQPFKLQHLYGGCMQCVCYVHMDYYKLLVCRMICPRWYRHAGPQLQLLKGIAAV